MNAILHDQSPQALLRAIEENAFAFFSLFGAWPPAEFHADHELMWFATDIPSPLFNSVMRACLAPEAVERVISAAIGRAAARQVPLSWMIGPTTRPAELGAALIGRGFVLEGENLGMAVDLAGLNEPQTNPPGLVVERVASMEVLRIWTETGLAGFGLPELIQAPFLDFFARLGLDQSAPMQHYLGWLDGRPVSISSLFLAAGVAGIYNVATVEPARRLGIGAQLTLAPLRAARQLGYRSAILHATPLGAGVYRALGFQEYCRLQNYFWSPEAQPAAGG